MLVLSRKQNDEILIGDGISIRVISVQGGRVVLGIKAPESVRIVRAEIVPRDDAEASDSGDVARSLNVTCDKSHDPARPCQEAQGVYPSQCS